MGSVTRVFLLHFLERGRAGQGRAAPEGLWVYGSTHRARFIMGSRIL